MLRDGYFKKENIYLNMHKSLCLSNVYLENRLFIKISNSKSHNEIHFSNVLRNVTLRFSYTAMY